MPCSKTVSDMAAVSVKKDMELICRHRNLAPRVRRPVSWLVRQPVRLWEEVRRKEAPEAVLQERAVLPAVPEAEINFPAEAAPGREESQGEAITVKEEQREVKPAAETEKLLQAEDVVQMQRRQEAVTAEAEHREAERQEAAATAVQEVMPEMQEGNR